MLVLLLNFNRNTIQQEGNQMPMLYGDTTVLRNFISTPTERRRALIVAPGAMSGILSGAALSALYKQGMHPQKHCVHSALGISAGAPNVTGWQAGKADDICEVYIHLAKRFFKIRRRVLAKMKNREDFMQVEYLIRHLQELLGVTQDPNTTEIFIGVSNYHGESVRIKVSESSEEELFNALRASVWIPGLFRGHIHLPHGKCVDGSCCPSILQFVKDVRPHEILYLSNRPREVSFVEATVFPLLVKVLMWQYPHELRIATAKMDTVTQDVLNRLDVLKCIKWCGIFPTPEESVSPIEYKPDVLRIKSEQYHKKVLEVCNDL